MGLGVKIVGNDGKSVSDSDVKMPSDMIAVGDAWLFVGPKPGASSKEPSKPNGYGAISGYSGRDPVAKQPANLQANDRRHKGLWNHAFCDGHVESIKRVDLFATTDTALRRWNRDNQPHR